MVSAAIGLAGSVAGGIASGKGAKKAAKIQAQAQAANRAQAQSMYNDAVSRFQPDIDRGNQAGSAISALLGLGGDTGAQQQAFQNWNNSTGYQFNLNQGLGAINSNAYATGMGNSGATMKALQDRGTQVANTYFNQYLGQLGNVQNNGAMAKTAITTGGQNLVNQITNANNQQAQTSGNNAMYQGNIISGGIKDLATVLQSSYKK